MSQTLPDAELIEAHIRHLLTDGDSQRARQLLSPLAQVDPIRHRRLSALLALSEQDYVAAEAGIQQLDSEGQATAVDLANLGMARLRLGQAEAACEPLERAVALDPDNLDSRYSLVSALLAAQKQVPSGQQADWAGRALKAARALTRMGPGDPVRVCALADACRVNRKWKQAIRLYQRALSLDPEHVAARLNLTVILAQAGFQARVQKHCEKVLESHPGHVLALQYLGDALLAQEQPDEAMHAFADAFEQAPDDPALCHRIGRAWLSADNADEAAQWFQRALAMDAECVPARIGLADTLRSNGEPGQALALLEDLRDGEQDNVEFLLSLGEAFWDDGEAEEALTCFRRAQELAPQRIALYSRIGRVLSSAGDVDGAIDQYHQGLKINAANVPCLSGLATTLKGKMEPALAEQMETMLAKPRYRDAARSTLHSGLAFYYEGQKRYEQAAHHSRAANECQWRYRSKASWSYDPAQHSEYVDRLIRCYDEDYFARLPGTGSDSEMPAFIVSMPRSGTTLTEQILARHSQVLGVGERDFVARGYTAFREVARLRDPRKGAMLEALRRVRLEPFAAAHLARFESLIEKSGKAGVTRVVDKMPDNYHLLGWIRTLFPRARLIHIRRDPRDVALSCWMTQFASISWASQPAHLVSRIRDYQRLMRHWRAVLGEHLLEINYEDLVADQETVSRQLVDWLGLDWDPACLSFYESDRLVRTASITQVRQPIYNKSVKKWEYYLPWLEDVLGELEDDR